MAAETTLFLLHVIGFAGLLWLGLYGIARGRLGGVAMLTTITALASSLFFLYGGILESLFTGPADVWLAIDRLGWFCDVLPLALWLHLSLRLNPFATGASWARAVLWADYSLCALIVFLGTATDLMRHYVALGQDPSGPLYGLYTGYLLVCTAVATVNLAAVRGRGASSEEVAPVSPVVMRLLVVGALCFLAGSSYESFRALLQADWPELAAFALLLAGLGAVAATVAVRSALLLGTDVRRDYLYSATGLAALLAPFLIITGALVGFDDPRRRCLVLAITALITILHTLGGRAREWLDAAFFSLPVREERAAARAYLEALAAPPAGPSPELATRKQFDDAVRRALTHLSDPTKLATSPLLNLRSVARAIEDDTLEDNRLNRAAALKETLLDLLDGLKPAGSVGGPTADAARFYNCLYYPYVLGISRRRAPTIQRQLRERRQRDGGHRSDTERIVDWLLQLDEDTFYKWQRRGSDTIAAALRERERALGEVVPSEVPETTAAVGEPSIALV
jgi:hypothetical protein